MNRYKINVIKNNKDNINDIFIKVLKQQIKNCDEYIDSSFFCGDN